MESGHQMTALLHQHRITIILGEHLYARSGPANDRRADKNGLHIARASALLEVRARRDIGHAAIDLTPVSIACHRQIHRSKTLLRGIQYFACEQDRSRAS